MKNDKLKKARNERGFTQKELARQLGVVTVTIRKWEDGTHTPSPEFRTPLSEILGKSLTQLGLDEDTEAPETPTLASSSFEGRPTYAENQNRKTMLNRVQTCWITGVLDYQETFIHLHLQEQPNAIINPWAETVQQTILAPQSLPAGTRIIDVYDESGGVLLLLGEPGAGKTTSLLELTRDLLSRASSDDTHPIPVIFNLSSWAQKRLPLPDWMVEELNSKYQVPHRLATQWVEASHILPLLDGLDEVSETYRSLCVQTINAYRKEHGFSPMVVCCRANEYLALTVLIALNRAITIKPLTFQQIDKYLSRKGKSFRTIQTALRGDTSLQEMVSTPLMLNIITLTFRDAPLDEITSIQDPEARRTLIFKKYVEVVLQHRGPQSQYSPEQTIHWLAWLAGHLKEQNQIEFYLERIQPDWLPNEHTRSRYRNMITRLVFGLDAVIISALFALFRGDSVPTKPGLFSWLGTTEKGNELLQWMRPGLGGGVAGTSSLDLLMVIVASLIVLMINMKTIPTLSLKAARIGLLRGLRNGLLIGGPIAVFSGLIFGFSSGLSTGVLRGVQTGLYSGLILLLVVDLNTMLRYNSKQHDQTHRSRAIDHFISMVIYALSGMLSFAFIYWIQAGETDLAIKYGAIVGISNAIYSLLSTDLIRGLGVHIEPAEIVAWSSQEAKSNLATHIHKAARLTLLVLITTITVFGCISSLFYGLAYGVRFGLIYGLITGLTLGITATLIQTLTSGWSSSILPKDQQFHPNEGIRRSAKNSILTAIVSGPIAGTICGIVIASCFKIVAGLAGWLTLGVGFGLILGIEFTIQTALAYGGIAVIEHYVLRWYLWREGNLPLNAIPFLDHAAERILLRKIGGGYMFSHRLLLEYFASLTPKKG